MAASSSELAIVGGLAIRTFAGLHLDILGAIGTHYYHGWGASHIGTDENDPGASATLPCVGARLRLTHIFSRQRRSHFLLVVNLGMIKIFDENRSTTVTTGCRHNSW